MINFLKCLENAEKDKTPQNLKYFFLLWYFVSLFLQVLSQISTK